MKIHEYQAKQLLQAAGVPVPRGIVADTPKTVANAFDALGGKRVVVKSQIHAGGRGKGTIRGLPAQHGVQLVASRDEAEQVARNLLGHRLVTAQTGPEGRIVRRLLVEESCTIARELYLGVAIDRAAASPVLIASSAGGMDIEEVARHTPDRIFRTAFRPDTGLWPYQARTLAWKLGLPQEKGFRAAEQFMQALARVFVAHDCSLVEVNPVVLTDDGRLLALDAKMSFDDNALFRHADLAGLRDLSEEDPAEIRAGEEGLSTPANFLDVGGGANVHQVEEAFRILLDDPHVRAVLVNIFGGIMRCTTIASALVEAYRSVRFHVPLVVRLEGTEVELARRMLAESQLEIIAADDLTDAAKKVVALAV